jgi:hypothetical protein
VTLQAAGNDLTIEIGKTVAIAWAVYPAQIWRTWGTHKPSIKQESVETEKARDPTKRSKGSKPTSNLSSRAKPRDLQFHSIA